MHIGLPPIEWWGEDGSPSSLFTSGSMLRETVNTVKCEKSSLSEPFEAGARLNNI
jgi:hypothetical protein